MNPGDKFSIIGYDIVASASCDVGQVLVLSNNSSHYIVAETECAGEDLAADGMHTVQRYPVARVHAIFDYSNVFEVSRVYAQALEVMAKHAVRWSSTLDGHAGDDAW